MHNYFSMFGLNAEYMIDKSLVKGRYETLLKKIHPDNYAQDCTLAKQVAQSSTARINSAYQTLINDHLRAIHLLKLKNCEIKDDDKIEDGSFLMEQFALQEALEKIQSKQEFMDLKQEIGQKLEALYSSLNNSFLNNDLASAKQLVLKATYFKNLNESKISLRFRD